MKTSARVAMVFILAGMTVQQDIARQGAPAPPPGSQTRATVDIVFDTSPLVECHFFLRTFGKDAGPPAPDTKAEVSSEASVYGRARELMTDEAAWRWFEDLVVTGPDPAAVREAAKTLPEAINTSSNRTGINMLTDGLESAYPKYLAGWWPDRQKSITRTLVLVRQKYLTTMDRVAPTLMEKMRFSPLDGPIKVYLVVRSGSTSSWGKVAGGYYAVVGVRAQSGMTVIESALHEATHILDNMQTVANRWLLRDVRLAVGKEAPAALDSFLHGIMIYSAGDLVRRFVASDYTPAGIRLGSRAEEFRPYMSTYELVWGGYLEGKMNYEAAVKKLVEEFRAVRKQQELLKKPAA